MNMELTEFKKKFEKHLSQGEMEEALELGLTWVKEATLREELILNSSRYNGYSRDKRLGLVNYDNLNVTRNQIDKSLIEMVRHLEARHLSSIPLEVAHRILVVNSWMEEKPNLSDFLKRVGLINLVTTFDGGNSPVIPPTNEYFNLILFDNRGLGKLDHGSDLDKEKEDRVKLIEDYCELKEENAAFANTYFLHYGEECYFVKNNREYFHAANSLFSLYHRIMEVLEFSRIYYVPSQEK